MVASSLWVGFAQHPPARREAPPIGKAGRADDENREINAPPPPWKKREIRKYARSIA